MHNQLPRSKPCRTARSERSRTAEGRARAAEQLKNAGIEGLVAIGGDGTFQGASRLSEEQGFPVVGVPGTIDNGLFGTDYTIGYDTAVNTAMEAIDKIRDTAASHDRLFYVEVMGRDAGFIALDVGISSGAEYILIPEEKTNIEALREEPESLKGRKPSVLGHVQRGGSPTAHDRLLASRLGVAAVESLLECRTNVMVGEIHGRIALTPLPETWSNRKVVDSDLWRLGAILAT